MDELSRLAAATTSDEVVDEVLARYGPDAALFAVDHEFGHLVRVDEPGESVALLSDRRRAMLRARPHFDGERTWVPLAERGQVVFVASVPGDRTAEASDHDVVGPVLGGHRRRFEGLERERRRTAMLVAAEMQWDLLPLRADTLGEYQVAGVLEPAYEVAGDVFEYAMDRDALWAYSFDGMGHGLDAAMTSVLVLSAIRNSRRQGGTLVDQMNTANEIMWRQYAGDRFVTGAACRLDGDGTVEMINAGHEPVRTVISGRTTRLDLASDLPLGVAQDPDYSIQHVTRLRPGDGIVMFSDGPAAQSAGGDPYGDDHLDEILTEMWSDVPLQTGHDVIGDVLEFIGDGRVMDDITAVVIRRGSSVDGGSR